MGRGRSLCGVGLVGWQSPARAGWGAPVRALRAPLWCSVCGRAPNSLRLCSGQTGGAKSVVEVRFAHALQTSAPRRPKVRAPASRAGLCGDGGRVRWVGWAVSPRRNSGPAGIICLANSCRAGTQSFTVRRFVGLLVGQISATSRNSLVHAATRSVCRRHVARVSPGVINTGAVALEQVGSQVAARPSIY